MPAGVAYLGKLIVDAVVAALAANRGGRRARLRAGARGSSALEGLLVAALAGVQRGIDFCQSLLRVLLSQRVHFLILDKALTLTLAQFEDSEFYDKLNRARQEASIRPLSLVNRTFALAQNAVSLASYAGLLFAFSPWAVAILVAAGLPAFVAETSFSGERFRAFQWRSPDRRMLGYLEIVLAREDHAKEVKLFDLGARLLARYREIFRRIYAEEKRLTIRRDGWGFVLGLVSSAAFYGAYAWIALATIDGAISLGEMTMYLLLFKQGQSAVAAMLSAIGGMYEDNLYLSNLYDYLEQPSGGARGVATTGIDARRRHRVRRRDVRLSWRRRAGAARRHAARAPRSERRARRLERLGEDDAREAVRGPVCADARERCVIRAATYATGIPSRCGSASA